MEQEKFNNGEWSVHRHPDLDSTQIIGVSTGEKYESNFASCKITLYNQENDANAHLIAQAPAMYRELKEIMDSIDVTSCGEASQVDCIGKILAKARGEFHTPAEVLSTLNTEVNE